MVKDITFHSFRGSERVKEAIDSFKDNIVVYFDPDVDGMIAGYLVCLYLQSIGKRFHWYVNSGRSHEWSLDDTTIRGKNVIAVDFQIPEEKVKSLVRARCNLVSMDHHVNGARFIDFKTKDNFGFVINNQYPFEPEDGRYLSGAGVVFETLRQISPAIDNLENAALVGLTLLSDVCDIENKSARGYLEVLYNYKYKGYIKRLIDTAIGEGYKGFGVPRLDRNTVDFSLSPKINACLRFNQEDMVVQYFLKQCDLDIWYHQKQKDLVQYLTNLISVKEFSNLRVAFFKSWEVEGWDREILSNFVGLMASRYLNGKKSVICYLVEKDEEGKPFVKRASFRGKVNGADYLKETEKFLHGTGHPSAFGIKSLVPTRELFEAVNEACGKAEKGFSGRSSVTPVSNLSLFAGTKGKSFAEYNIYCLSQNRKYLRYVGKNIKIKREGAKYREYEVDGISVMCFDLGLDFSTGVVLPTLERGFVKYYLQTM